MVGGRVPPVPQSGSGRRIATTSVSVSTAARRCIGTAPNLSAPERWPACPMEAAASTTPNRAPSWYRWSRGLRVRRHLEHQAVGETRVHRTRQELGEGEAVAYVLLDGFSLGAAAGPAPKKTIDAEAGPTCSPYKTCGTLEHHASIVAGGDLGNSQSGGPHFWPPSAVFVHRPSPTRGVSVVCDTLRRSCLAGRRPNPSSSVNVSPT